jgi:hypothetical protein
LFGALFQHNDKIDKNLQLVTKIGGPKPHPSLLMLRHPFSG